MEDVISRALELKEPSLAEATSIFAQCPTELLVNIADRIRDRTRPRPVVTYSRKVFFNLVNLCRDFCLYCTYKKEISSTGLSMMSPDAVLALAEQGKKMRCTEALIVT